MKRAVFVAIGILLILMIGYYLEHSVYFSPLKERLQDKTVPSAKLNFGKIGQLMEKLKIGYAISAHYAEIPNTSPGHIHMKNILKLDTTGLTEQDAWISPKDLVPSKVPSSLVLDPGIIETGLPILSIVIDDKDLDDPATGIFANYEAQGRQWERLCFVSYYEHGDLMFASGAGVRVHGQKREALRLYFRDMYGASEFKPGILFSDLSTPLKRLVVHDDTRVDFHFVNPLVYDISRQVGGYAPETKPVKVFLNGRPFCEKLSMSLTEYLSKEYLTSHFGHDEFVFVRTKGRKNNPVEYRRLLKWAGNRLVSMSMEEVRRYVDLDNLAHWWIVQFYCADTDIFQGLAALDKSKANPKWFWVSWDLDHSFRNKSESQDIKLWEQEKIFHDLVSGNNPTGDPRATLFKRLTQEDPKFIKYFEQMQMTVMNHLLTNEFIMKRIDYYQNVSTAFGLRDLHEFERIREFVLFRPAYIRKLMMKYFDSPESYQCVVNVPKQFAYKVDGYVKHGNYSGWYYSGARIAIGVGKTSELSNVYLVINGERKELADNTFSYQINSNTQIEVVVEHKREQDRDGKSS